MQTIYFKIKRFIVPTGLSPIGESPSNHSRLLVLYSLLISFFITCAVAKHTTHILIFLLLAYFKNVTLPTSNS